MHNIKLSGCMTEPFSSYLKSLAIIKLLGEQKDKNLKGYWIDNILYIQTELQEEEIIKFFLNEYKPTPIIAPWLNKSGFWPDDPKESINIIVNSENSRLNDYKSCITIAKDIIKPLNLNKIEEKDKNIKKVIVSECRNKMCDRAVEWIDASILLTSDEKIKYPPINGTGGNDAKLEYTHVFMEHLADMLLIDNNANNNAEELLKNAIFNDNTDKLIKSKSIGKFNPGLTGGLNQGNGFESKNFPINPWDFIFFMEGSLLWASGIGKRNDIDSSSLLSPFTTKLSNVGTSENSENNKNNEIWAPIWANPTGIYELKTFFREGRAEIGNKSVHNGLEFIEAVNSLGVDRGIIEFVRFASIERRGQAHIVSPLGHFPVSMKYEVDLVKELDPILAKIDIFIKKIKNSAGSYKSAKRQIENAIFEYILHGENYRAKAILAALGKMEQLMSKQGAGTNILSGLSIRWLKYSDDGSIEYRIAAAIASIGNTGAVGSIRINLEPIDPDRPTIWADRRGQFAWEGNNLSERLSNVLYRRILDSERLNLDRNPLFGRIKLSEQDIAHFIDGDVNDKLIEDLIFGMMLIKWDDPKLKETLEELNKSWEKPIDNKRIVLRQWALLKLLFLSDKIKLDNSESEIVLKPEKRMISLLMAGRVRDASIIAKNRLLINRFITFKTSFPDGAYGQRLAAALIVPVKNYRNLIKLVLDKTEMEEKI